METITKRISSVSINKDGRISMKKEQTISTNKRTTNIKSNSSIEYQSVPVMNTNISMYPVIIRNKYQRKTGIANVNE